MQHINLPRLNRIWNGIQSGQLEHVQDTYHCNTAHCVAGWEVYFLTQEQDISHLETAGGSTPTEQIEELARMLGLKLSHNPDDSELAAASLGLNKTETVVLFDPDAPTVVQSALVAYLNTGKRLPSQLCDVCYNYNHYTDATGDHDLILKGSAAVWKEFTDFLEDKSVTYTHLLINYDR